MREVKMQGWSRQELKWLPVAKYEQSFDNWQGVYTPTMLTVILCNGEHVTYDVNIGGMPIRVFTGLKDKNGREIYEGDIVAMYNVDYGYVVGRGAFRWDDETAGYVHSWLEFAGDECLNTWRPSKRLWLAEDANIQLEVIGNIHENPELLK